MAGRVVTPYARRPGIAAPVAERVATKLLTRDHVTSPALTTWADRIRPHLDGAVEHIIAAGRELVNAKDALPHGAFGDLVESLGLTARTAQRFMAIARHQVLGDATHVSHLPPSWSTLFELSRLPEDVVTDAIGDGRVHPGMRRHEVQALTGPDPAVLMCAYDTAVLRQAYPPRTDPQFWDMCQDLYELRQDDMSMDTVAMVANALGLTLVATMIHILAWQRWGTHAPDDRPPCFDAINDAGLTIAETIR